MTQLRLASADGRVEAAVDTVGGGLARLVVGGVAVVDEVAVGEQVLAAAGAVLLPWPNRVRDARWLLDGEPQQLTMTEPGRRTANHGFLLGRELAVTSSSPEQVELAATVTDEPGYPFTLGLLLRYSLLPDGVAVEATVTNDGAATAPVAIGFHPYLRVGDHPIAELALEVATDAVVVVDERLLPVGLRPPGEGEDWAGGVPVGDRELHECVRSVARDGRHVHRLVAPDGDSVELSASADLAWLQVYAHPALPRPDGRAGRGLAVEPQSAPADALNSGTGLRWLEPGGRWTTAWSLRHVALARPR